MTFTHDLTHSMHRRSYEIPMGHFRLDIFMFFTLPYLALSIIS